MADGSRSFFCLPSSWAGRHISMRLRTQQPIPLIPQDPGLDNPRQMACRRASSAGPEPLSTRLQRASPGPRLQLPETSRVSPCAGGVGQQALGCRAEARRGAGGAQAWRAHRSPAGCALAAPRAPGRGPSGCRFLGTNARCAPSLLRRFSPHQSQMICEASFAFPFYFLLMRRLRPSGGSQTARYSSSYRSEVRSRIQCNYLHDPLLIM